MEAQNNEADPPPQHNGSAHCLPRKKKTDVRLLDAGTANAMAHGERTVRLLRSP